MTAAAQSVTADRLLFGLSMVCGVVYLLTRGRLASPAGVAVKGLSIAPLALIAFRQLAGSNALLLGAALLLSSLGDVFLALNGEQWFTYGLGSFLIAHLFYITLFVHNWPKPFTASRVHQLIAALLIGFAAALFWWLWPGLGEMKLPVTAYMCALTGMGVTATLVGFRAWWVVVGAALFILSDSLIAVGKFKSPVAFADYLIWATYYTAQVLIALGFIGEKRCA